MRYALVLLVLTLAGCLHLGELPGYGRPIQNDHCLPVVVDNRRFEDVTIYLGNVRHRVGFAPGLTRTSLQTCRLTAETAHLVVDPIGGRSFLVPLPVSPMGQRLVRLTIGATNALTTVEIF